jgi:hypothetical protein
MAAPLRGTQSLVGQMGWVVGQRPLIAIEIAWRWIFGIPFLALCWIEADRVFAAVPADSAGLNALDAQNPWIASVELARAWSLYRPHVFHVARWVAPVAALAWIVVSGLGRGLVLRRIDPDVRLRFRPFAMMMLQAGWLALLGATCWGWFACMEWLVATYISSGAEPDLVGFAIWAIFLSLGFFTLWALVSWALSIAPLLMLLEDCSALCALGRSLRLGKAFTSKLAEINLVMGIVNLALIVLAMVLSAAPLPFSDELGADALHWVNLIAVVFYLLTSDYFQVVRLKGFEEFWKMFRGPQRSLEG